MPHTARRTAPQENFNTEVAVGLVPSSGALQLLKFFTRRYGQLAFGVLTLLTIYQVMLKPMLDQKVDVASPPRSRRRHEGHGRVRQSRC